MNNDENNSFGYKIFFSDLIVDSKNLQINFWKLFK